MNRRRTLLLTLLGVALIFASPHLFKFKKPAEGPAPGPRIGKAGETTDVVPKAWRGESEEAGRELARANSVFWQDVVWTARRGRARLAIVDGSVLNLGPETRLRILPQDERTSHSSVVLNFGKIRAQVKERRQGRRLEIRTPTAVIGVVGTEFYVDATAEKTRVICLEGKVTVRNQRVGVAGVETLSAGEKTEVLQAEPPAPKAKASDTEMEQARAITRSTPLDVALTDRQGNRVNLRDRGGRVLVLHFWAAWAAPSLAQIPDLNRLHAEFRDQDVEFIGVAMDAGGWGAIAASQARTPINYLVLLDEGNRAAQTLGVRAFPTTLFVDRYGRIVGRQLGLINRDRLRRQIQRLL